MEQSSAHADRTRPAARRPIGASRLAARLRPTDLGPAFAALRTSGALTLATVVVKLLLMELAGANTGLVIYVPAVAVAAWYRGFLGGLLATLLSALIDIVIFSPPLYVVVIDVAPLELRLLAFLAGGVVVSYVSHRMRSGRDRARTDVVERNQALGDAAAARDEVERVTALERRANELRDAFNSIISHELRTPITAIYGGAKLLASTERELDPATRTDLILDLEAEADRLYRLVEDLLVLAKSERGTVERTTEPLLLSRLVARVVRSERERWPQTRFAVHVDKAVAAARGDETYVEQVIRNLLSNAAKYSPPRALVQILVDETAEGVRLRVLDDGPGIEPSEATRLFELYYRSPSTATSVSGAGIGLYVCRVLIDAMGGRIWAAPRPEGGSLFGFVLQCNDEDDIVEDPPAVFLRTAATEAPDG
jgi:K+-sensing histidine kinase KdpD